LGTNYICETNIRVD